MTWTYVPDFSLAKDRVRLLIGDTDSSDPLISDEEISVHTTGVLAPANDYLAAAAVCDAIAGKFSRRADMSTGASSVSLSQQVTQYERKARELRRRSATRTAPYVGSATTEPAFTRQMGDEVLV